MNPKELSKKKWVIQGFNSSLNYIMHGPVSSLALMNKNFDNAYTEQLFIFEKDYLDYYYLEKDFITVGNEFMNKFNKNKNYFNELVKKSDELVLVEESVKEKVKQIDLDSLSKKELIELFHEITDSYTQPLGISHVIEGISFVIEPRLKTKLSKAINLNHHDKEFREILSKLIEPSRASWIGEEGLELLKIAKIIFESNDFEEFIKSKKLSEKNYQLVDEHKKKFYYYQLNYYYADGLKIQDYIDELHKILSSDIDLKIKISEEENKYKINKENRNKIIKKYNLSKEIIDLVNLVEKVSLWQDARKKDMLSALFFLNKVTIKISEEFDIPLDVLKMCSWKEINLENLENFDLKKGKERLKEFAVYFWNNHGKLEEKIIFGKEFADFMKDFNRTSENQEHIHGMCASTGKAMGKVRICKTVEDISKCEEGEILVSMMTRPEFIPAMKKASAIITDEGGITCHAAIVSRELGKPCIIGTKLATKTLKNGQIVEVNANHGLVKVIE